MPVTEVQWIGASCGRHSSYTFYRGFRLIVDGVVKNFCLGEFYFVRNSTNQPICIAELQLVWHDATSDSKLASARLYFRPEDTPIGRLPNHGQDELLYADQKVVVKCHDMAVWQDSGLQWNCGLVPLYESDFVCINEMYYLNSNYATKEKERMQKATEAWQNGGQHRSLQILTFPAYCRYRALKKRLLAGACLTRAQLIALGGILGDQTSTRVLFCKDSFHHPYLDKFELAGDNKAPVLKGRPRKKKRLNATQNSVLKKKQFVADIQNHVGSSPAAKRCKISEEDESASSDISEGVLERIKVPPQAAKAAQSNGPPPLVNSEMQVSPKAAGQYVPLPNPKPPPPLISSNSVKGDVRQNAQLSREQVNVKVVECSRTTPMQKQISSMDVKLRKVEKPANNNNNTVLLVKSQLADNVQPRVSSAPITSGTSVQIRRGKILNSSVENKHPSHAGKNVTNPHGVEHKRTITASQADPRSHSATSTRPVTTTQGTLGTQLAVSTSAAVRSQPVASLAHPVASVQEIAPKPQQTVTPLADCVSSAAKTADGLTSGGPVAVRSKPRKENEERQLRSAWVSEEKKENEIEQTEEPVVCKKKKKRLRMPGSIKDEEYDDEDEKYFMQTLRDFMRKTNQPLGKLPALGFKKVNLWTMYTTAQRFGGYDAVTSKRLWRRVYDSLGGSTTITSAATYTKRHYERLLLPFERHIRSQLKKQMDEKSPSTVNNPAMKEPLSKSEKKQGLTVFNSKPKPSTSPVTNKAPAVKQNQAVTEANPARPPPQSCPPQSCTAVSSPHALPVQMKVASEAMGNAVKTTDSAQTSEAVTVSTVHKDHIKQELSPVRSAKQEYQESKLWSNKAKAAVPKNNTLPTERRDKVIPSEQFQLASSQQNTNYRCIKVMSSDDETSARTNMIYSKNTAAVDSSANQNIQAASLQRVIRVANDGSQMSSPPQQLNTASKEREVIDLTLDDSPPRLQLKSHSVPHVQSPQANPQDVPKVSRPDSGRDIDGRRHASKPQLRKDYQNGSTKHHSYREVQSSREISSSYDVQTYSVHPQGKPKVSPQLPESSPVSTVKRKLDEVYPSFKQETGLPKHDKKRHQQTRVESMEGRITHSPSSDSVDEHFAEWLRRQSSAPPQQTKHRASHDRHAGNSELDCPCFLHTSRKDDNTSVPLLKPKKEHYEEDLPFAGMTLYPGGWSPTMLAADQPDLYISSHAAHLPPPPDSLPGHMCSSSRIFIPTAQLFSSPYHLGMAPMGGPPLIAGADDQLHIHPHCLMASSYPCTTSSRTPDGVAYPLYSFT